MKIKNKYKNKIFSSGLKSSSGICINGDIGLSCKNNHTYKMNLILRIIIAFFATFSTCCVVMEFTNSDIYYSSILLLAIVDTIAFGILKSKYNILKGCSLIFIVCQLIYLFANISRIATGFAIVYNSYLNRSKISGFSFSVDVEQYFYSYYVYGFFMVLVLTVSLLMSIACVYKYDFVILFITSFAALEIGLYWGWIAHSAFLIILIICWVIILSLNIANHTTNKASRNNTFSVNERKKTFYITSEKEKSSFYSVYIIFASILCVGIFALIVLFSKMTGFVRPESFTTYRNNISNTISDFSFKKLSNALEDYNGGLDLFGGVKTVGGINGGKLGRTDGIKFNNTSALKLNINKYKHTLYLRGYVAGKYKNNSWVQVDADTDSDKIVKDFKSMNYWTQDMNFITMNATKNAGIIDAGNTTPITVTVTGASKRFAYAPYGALYSSDSNKGDDRISPTNESYVKLGAEKYTLQFFNETSTYQNVDAVGNQFGHINGKDVDDDSQNSSASIYNDEQQTAFSSYKKYITNKYSKADNSKALTTAYNNILINYFAIKPSSYSKSDYSCSDVYSTIKQYLSDNYSYTLNPGKTPDGEDFIDYFLTKQKKGYCSYFATVGVELMRKFGYSARFVEGYIVTTDQYTGNSDYNGTVNVKDTSAHAWCEIFDDEIGWVPCEFTPDYDDNNPNAENKTDSSSSMTDSSSNSSDSSANSAETSSNSATTSVAPATPATTSSKSDSSSSISGGGSAGGISSGAASSGSDKNSENKTDYVGLIIILIGVILITAAVIFNRKLKLAKMSNELNCKNQNKRAIYIYRYLLEYLNLIDVTCMENLSDLQICEKLIEKLHKLDINNADESLRNITQLALYAQMSNNEITESDTDNAYQQFDEIKNKIILPKLNRIGLFTAKYLKCLM